MFKKKQDKKKIRFKKKLAGKGSHLWSPCLIPYKSCKGCNACASFSGWLTWYPINPVWQTCWIYTAVTEAKETFERAEHFTYYQTQRNIRSWGLTLKIIVHLKGEKTLLPLPGTVENVSEQLQSSLTAVLWRPTFTCSLQHHVGTVQQERSRTHCDPAAANTWGSCWCCCTS